MKQNRRRTAQEWSEIFVDWRRTDESQRGYCQREGISISAFGYWHRKLEKGTGEQPFVRVSSGLALPGAGRNGLTARAGGVVVDLNGCESEQFLIRVFRALKAVS